MHLFPDPLTGQYKSDRWRTLGAELQSLLTREEYDSAKRTTFNAFYTSPVVVRAMHQALQRLGVSDQALILEPGCGAGRFLAEAAPEQRFLGIELDSISGRIARALYPRHEIRIENFRDTKFPAGGVEAVIGNVPFANLKLTYQGTRYPLHDYFFAKSVDGVKPGGVLALVTSRYTLDKLDGGLREQLAEQADFLGAIRLPGEAFKAEGTRVVTDVVFLKKRAPGEPAHHVDPDWLQTGQLDLEGRQIAVNRYFLNHPEMILGRCTAGDSLYGREDGLDVEATGNLAEQLQDALERLPKFEQALPPTRLEQTPATAFSRPPPSEPTLTEGSFFVDDDHTIRQIVDGQNVPVVYGGKTLNTLGSNKTGRRLAALIELRDDARAVLRTQNEGRSPEERAQARRQLSLAYDRFVARYGPINLTTLGTTRQGGVIRRTPNLVKFREDPDAMLVASLEEYDETSGRATKTAIFDRDVVGPRRQRTQVESAEEGLLASLDQTGRVDLELISQLYGKSEATIIEELGELIFLNPATQEWETADVYLSGNVREKLAIAQQEGEPFARNAERLREVQPPDVLPGDIDARLGAPWIPTADIAAFAAELFGCEPEVLQIGHVPQDAFWSVEAKYTVEHSVAATADFGTSRISGVKLLEQALNLQTPTIYDRFSTPDGEERVVNQEETLAAREKQKLIKERFCQWAFADPERSERLVRLYNDAFNNLRPRAFDGAHLDFPGMNQAIRLQPHQRDAVWRIMSSPNTLLAHAVGAGKTFSMAAAGMKLRQAGLARKPLYVVPNHMLEQFSREFQLLYPNAHLLVASKEQLGKDRRKQFAARIAGGDWDGIVMTHSSFERIALSSEHQERFLKEQIAEYEQLLVDSADGGRNLLKQIEKQKAGREQRLKELLASEKKDDGLVFDELGVDHVFLDEAHYFKNLETPTKMQRVAGIQTGGSQRAFDLYLKARYLEQQGGGVTFATGTPISNTMVELFTLQRYLDPQGLSARGVGHFDAWAATFGEVVEALEISPDGASLRPRSRFARFNNLPELQQMFRAFADVQTADLLDLPRPALAGGKPATVSCPMSESQAAIQQELVDRYERIRSQKVDPREDNALAITTDGRKLALDPRLLDASAADDPDSKVNAAAAQVARIWRETTPSKGTQMIFCDLGVKPTPWGFSVYDELVANLTAQGIPREQIAAIGEAETDVAKQALFQKVRSGAVRVLIGSTQKMGAGTNVQQRLVALHHLDAPWKPAEVEQREGRILRQGNENQEVAIYRYVTAGSFDAYMWQALETKAKFISQVMTGRLGVRSAEDMGGQELSFAEVKAIASGNPAVLTLAEADAALQQLALLKKSHLDGQFLLRRRLRELPEQIERLESRLENLAADARTMESQAEVRIEIGARPYSFQDALAVLGGKLDRLPPLRDHAQQTELGKFHGLTFGIQRTPFGRNEVYLQGAARRSTALARDAGPRALLNAAERLTESMASQVRETTEELELARRQLADYRQRQERPFEQEDLLAELTRLRNSLRQALSRSERPEGADAAETPEEAAPTTQELSAEIKELLASRQGAETAEPAREAAVSTAEEPIAARLRRHVAQTEYRDVEAEQVTEEQSVAESDVIEEAAAQEEETAAAAREATNEAKPEPAAPNVSPAPRPNPVLERARPRPTSHRGRARRYAKEQLSLF